jgi:glycosyltransferase 2 family protein
MRASQAGIVVLKLIVTCVLLWFVFHKVDIAPLLQRLGTLQMGWVVAALVILFSQLMLTGVRWYFVGHLVGAGASLTLAARLILVGQFFNQVLPSSVGGDGVRAWLLSREGISIRRALVSVICDRAAALVLLTVIVACTLPIVISSGQATIPWAWSMAITVEVLSATGLLFLFIWGERFSSWLIISLPAARPIGVLMRDLRCVLFSSVKSLWVVSLTVIVQAMVVMSAYCCALALGVEFGLVHLLMLPLIMLVSSIPVSFAGWGLRESAMVTGLGFASIPAADALAVSVSFGIAQLLVGLPGLVIAVMSMYWGSRTDNQAATRPIQ